MINGILSSAHLSVLINGCPHDYFSCSRGVRQGDPLSPLLFCITEEVLIRWLDYAIDSHCLTVHKKLPRYLLYADDIMIFLEATKSNGQNLKKLLEDYGSISGQIFSPPKSSVFYDSSASSSFKLYIKNCTSIAIDCLPFNYLGVPIFWAAPKVEYLSPIADSIIAIFSRWRGHSLSLDDHRCLINSVIASSLVHTMMIYRWPRTLLHHLEVAIRSYLWTGDANKKRLL